MLLIAQDIHTYYGKSHILQGASMEVKEKEIVALLGRNGVGKSTTLKSIIVSRPFYHLPRIIRGGRYALPFDLTLCLPLSALPPDSAMCPRC